MSLERAFECEITEPIRPAERLTEFVPMRASPSQRDTWDQAARAFGFTNRGEYLRAAADALARTATAKGASASARSAP